MYLFTYHFLNLLDNVGIEYTAYGRDKENGDQISISQEGENLKLRTMSLSFEEGDVEELSNRVRLCLPNYVSVPAENVPNVLWKLNECNQTHRFLKFTYNQERGAIQVEQNLELPSLPEAKEMPGTLYGGGRKPEIIVSKCISLAMMRMFRLCDELYPEIAEAVLSKKHTDA